MQSRGSGGNNTFNQLHNDTAYGFVENLYHDNKEVYQKMIKQLEKEINRLEKENMRLLAKLEEKK